MNWKRIHKLQTVSIWRKKDGKRIRFNDVVRELKQNVKGIIIPYEKPFYISFVEDCNISMDKKRKIVKLLKLKKPFKQVPGFRNTDFDRHILSIKKEIYVFYWKNICKFKSTYRVRMINDGNWEIYDLLMVRFKKGIFWLFDSVKEYLEGKSKYIFDYGYFYTFYKIDDTPVLMKFNLVKWRWYIWKKNKEDKNYLFEYLFTKEFIEKVLKNENI